MKKTECMLCKYSGKPLFRFPKDPNRCKTWIKMLMLEERLKDVSVDYIYNNCRLCSAHFSKEAFTSSLKNNKSRGALPLDLRNTKSPSTSFVKDGTSAFSPQIFDDENVPLASTPVHKPARNILTPKTREISRLRCKMSKLKKKLFNDDKLLDKLKHLLTVNQYEFVLSQIRSAAKKTATGRRWTAQEKTLAMKIFHQSPSAYAILRKYLAFPCKNTLRKCIGNIAKDDGFCPLVFKALSTKVTKLKKEEKLCTLVFDEIAIKSHLSYNAVLDVVDGFESAARNGEPPQLATQALVFMIRGISQKWKQVVAYYFKANSAPDGWFKDAVIAVLDKVLSCGFRVVALVCDQGPVNRGVFKALGLTSKSTFFTHSGKKIYGLYDMPHLLKCVRNNLKNYNLTFNEVKEGNEVKRTLTASWKDIEDLYISDCNRKYKVAPKLTKQHIYAKGLSTMKVKLASQVFSHSVAAGLELCAQINGTPASLGTADFVATMNDLFDSMNSSSKYGKGLSCAVSKDSDHVKKWKQWIPWVESWKFVSPAGKRITPPTQRGLILTLKSVQGVWEEVKDSIPFLMTNRLNQDCIENSFSSVRKRGGFRDNPNTQEFRSAIRNITVTTLMKSTNSKNVEDDSDCNLIEINNDSMTEIFEISDEEDDTLVIDMDQEEVPAPTGIEENVIAYVSGFISKSVLRYKSLNSCDQCMNLLVDGSKTLDKHSFLLYYKEYEDSFQGLKWPTDNYFKYMLALSDCFFRHVNNYITKKNVRKDLCSVLHKVDFGFFGNHAHRDDVHSRIVHSFVTMMIKHEIKKRNNENGTVNIKKKLSHVKHL